jgi:hypothetical protein
MAGTKKEPRLLRTPITNADRDIISRKGKSLLVKDMANRLSCPEKPGAIRKTKKGARIMPSKTTRLPAIINNVRA